MKKIFLGTIVSLSAFAPLAVISCSNDDTPSFEYDYQIGKNNINFELKYDTKKEEYLLSESDAKELYKMLRNKSKENIRFGIKNAHYIETSIVEKYDKTKEVQTNYLDSLNYLDSSNTGHERDKINALFSFDKETNKLSIGKIGKTDTSPGRDMTEQEFLNEAKKILLKDSNLWWINLVQDLNKEGSSPYSVSSRINNSFAHNKLNILRSFTIITKDDHKKITVRAVPKLDDFIIEGLKNSTKEEKDKYNEVKKEFEECFYTRRGVFIKLKGINYELIKRLIDNVA